MICAGDLEFFIGSFWPVEDLVKDRFYYYKGAIYPARTSTHKGMVQSLTLVKGKISYLFNSEMYQTFDEGETWEKFCPLEPTRIRIGSSDFQIVDRRRNCTAYLNDALMLVSDRTDECLFGAIRL